MTQIAHLPRHRAHTLGILLAQREIIANPGLSAREGWYTLRRTFLLQRYSNDWGEVWPKRPALRFAFSKKGA